MSGRVEQDTGDTSWIFTFGAGQEHDGGYVRITGADFATARERMVAAFGVRWSAQYADDAGAAAMIETWRMHEVPMPAPPPAPVADVQFRYVRDVGVRIDLATGRVVEVYDAGGDSDGDEFAFVAAVGGRSAETGCWASSFDALAEHVRSALTPDERARIAHVDLAGLMVRASEASDCLCFIPGGPEPCTQCNDLGYLIGQTYGEADDPPGDAPFEWVQRCDECSVHEGDEDATIAAALANQCSWGKSTTESGAGDEWFIWWPEGRAS